MKKNYFRYAALAVLLYILIYAGVILKPGVYHVPQLVHRVGTQYWNLPTGSKIGYTKVPGMGEKKNVPVIFLQGGPGGFISDRNIKMLSPLSEDGYDVYLYDQAGSGQSAHLEDIREYTADRHKKDLEEIVKQIGSPKVIIIGQSRGAILATLFIADNPGKVDKLILTGPGPIQPMNEELLQLMAPDSLHLRKPAFTNRQANEMVRTTRVSAIEFVARTFGKRLASEKEVDDYETALNNELNKATVCDSTRALPGEGGGGFYVQVMTVQSFSEIKDPRMRLKNSPVPLLIMKGQCDSQPWGFAAEYLDLFPNHLLQIIPDAGHSISVEQPELYISAIRNFLSH